jgi:preprotein translocase subunit SecD
MTQPSFPPYQPTSQRRGPVVLLGVLVLVLVAAVVAGVIVVLRLVDDKPAAAATKPSTPQAVEFRRVLTAAQGTCASPLPKGIVCDANGVRYTVGKVELDGSHVSEVKAAQSPDQPAWYITLTLDEQGTRAFAALTTQLATLQPPKNQLAIVVGGQVAAAPTVTSAITAGKVQISGGYTQKDAEALASKITG